MSTLKPRKAGYHHGDLREALVEAGLEILAEGGDPAALSLREAARRAGVSAMAPYRHFPDKEALLGAVASIGFDRLAKSLAAADAHSDPREALVEQGVAYVAFACADPAMFRLMFGAALPEKRGVLAEAGLRSYAIMAERVASLVPKDMADIAALQCWASAHGLAALAVDGQLDDRGLPPLKLAETVLRTFTARGLAPVERGRPERNSS